MGRTAVKFGLFVALCLSFTLYLASTIGNTSILGLFGHGKPTYTLKASFADVTGLLINDNVKIAGVPVGKVTDIDVESGKAVVTMAIDDDRIVPADSAAAIRWRNLIGQRYIYLYPGDAPTRLEDGDTVSKTRNVIDLGELFNRLGPIVATIDEGKVNDFLDTVTTALEGNQDDISKAVDDLAFVVKSLGDRDQAIGRLIDNLETVSRTVADRDTQIETMLDNLASLARTFSDNTSLLENAIVQMGSFNRDLSTVLSSNRSEIDGIITSLDNTLNTVESKHDALDTALDKLDESASATFRSSRNGEFLNQAVLCLTVSPPPCPTPIVPGIGSVTGNAATDAVPFQPQHRSGGDAVLSLVGGTWPQGGER